MKLGHKNTFLCYKISFSKLKIVDFIYFIFHLLFYFGLRARVSVMSHITVTSHKSQSYNYVLQKNIIKGFRTMMLYILYDIY